MGFFGDIGKTVGNVATGGLFGLLGGIGGGGGLGFGPPKNAFTDPQNQRVTDLQNQLGGMQAPKDLSSYVAKDYSQPLPEFDQVKQQTAQNLTTANQQQQDALQRRFAAMGNLNSGAYIHATQDADRAANENRANAMAGIGFQEAQQRRGLQQQEAQKEFQSGENTKQFNAQQANQFNQFKFDATSKIGQLDLAFRNAEQNSADEQYNALMNAYQAKHSGGLLGSGGFLGTGIGV